MVFNLRSVEGYFICMINRKLVVTFLLFTQMTVLRITFRLYSILVYFPSPIGLMVCSPRPMFYGVLIPDLVVHLTFSLFIDNKVVADEPVSYLCPCFAVSIKFALCFYFQCVIRTPVFSG